MDKAEQKSCVEMGERIENMVQELKRRGFSRPEAVSMVAAMLASTQVYVPFADVTVERMHGGLH